MIPVAAVYFALPFKLNIETRKRVRGENQAKTFVSVWDSRDENFQHFINPANKRFTDKAGVCIVENPLSLVFVWRENA